MCCNHTSDIIRAYMFACARVRFSFVVNCCSGNTLFTIIWDDQSAKAPAGANFPALTAWVTIGLVMPLCFLKSMSHIGFTSLLSLLPLVYMFGFQVIVTNGSCDFDIFFATMKEHI